MGAARRQPAHARDLGARAMAFAVAFVVAAGMLVIAGFGSRAGASPARLIDEAGYRLAVSTESGLVEVQLPDGTPLTSFPLAMQVGPARGPLAAPRVRVDGNVVRAAILSAHNAVLATAVLTASPQWFTVRFTLSLPAPDSPAPLFFSDGRRGFDMSAVTAGYSPDVPNNVSRFPAVLSAGRRPLSPAPLDVQLHTAGGWLGIGFVQVPNASSLRVQPDGAVAVDYPLRQLEELPDTGGGGRSGAAVRFPAFVITVAADVLSGLSTYHSALVAAGTAPASGGPQAAWWHLPIVDTWGAQNAEKVARGSPGFNAAWVRSFVADVERRYGLRTFTVVIDSRWQAELGDATPDARFGGIAGMRSLVDDLHAQGLRVMLWWPLWALGNGAFTVPAKEVPVGALAPAAGVDPTAPGFDAAMTATVDTMLGHAAGDIGADGLKLDWAYDIPRQVADPALGWGDAALYRYLAVIHRAAHAIDPQALVEASSAAPQFAAVTDSVRLYDAWSEKAWDERAAIVAVSQPGVIIDGDGWQATPSDAISHALSSAVYGVPALYFDSRWATGQLIPAGSARLLGSIASLAAAKGAGTARPLAGGGWSYASGGGQGAQTLGDEAGAVFWNGKDGTALIGHLISTAGGLVTFPLPQRGRVRLVDPAGALVHVSVSGLEATARLGPGITYAITVG